MNDALALGKTEQEVHHVSTVCGHVTFFGCRCVLVEDIFPTDRWPFPSALCTRLKMGRASVDSKYPINRRLNWDQKWRKNLLISNSQSKDLIGTGLGISLRMADATRVT